MRRARRRSRPRHGPRTKAADVRGRLPAACPSRPGGYRGAGLRDAGLARRNGLAVATRVAGDATDGHVDAESRGGALLFGLGTPEAVLPVLAGPVAAFLQRGA